MCMGVGVGMSVFVFVYKSAKNDSVRDCKHIKKISIKNSKR